MKLMVIGNGQSRQNVNLKSLNCITVGCNAIHRDFCVDHLVCVDRKMAQEASLHPRLYTRQDWISSFPKAIPVPPLPYDGDKRHDEPFNWGSGPYAVLIACKLSTDIHLLGFDLYSEDKKINNLYKDTENYNDYTHRAIDPRYWIAQIGKLFEIYPAKQFTIHQPEGWELPKYWCKENVSVDNETFFK